MGGAVAQGIEGKKEQRNKYKCARYLGTRVLREKPVALAGSHRKTDLKYMMLSKKKVVYERWRACAWFTGFLPVLLL